MNEIKITNRGEIDIKTYQMVEDKKILSNITTLNPGDDLTGFSSEIRDIALRTWTDSVLANWQTLLSNIEAEKNSIIAEPTD